MIFNTVVTFWMRSVFYRHIKKVTIQKFFRQNVLIYNEEFLYFVGIQRVINREKEITL